MSITTVIFDLGGVLLRWNPLALYQKHFPHLSSTEIELFMREINFSAWNTRQDQGRSFDEGVSDLAAQFPHRARLIEAYHTHWLDCVDGPIEGSVRILKRLKDAGLGLYGLTNFSAEKFRLTRPHYPFLNDFDAIIVSGEVKLVKPDPAIYRLALAQIGRTARECVFIDDSAPNVTTASALGFTAIQFRSAEQLASELTQLGLFNQEILD